MAEPVSIIEALIENDNLLRERGVYEKVVDWMRRATPHHVLVVGASGTGKSSLLRSVRGLDAAIRREDRTEFPVEVRGKIDKELFVFHDTPGEEEHRSRRFEVIKTLNAERPLGIINVVSYGYHEGAARVSDVFDGDTVRESFLDAMRQREIGRLAEWASVLCGGGGSAGWVLTAVTKADLWWITGDDQPVREHYIRGAYGESLGLAASAQARSVVAYSSLNQQLFYGRLPMSGYYSDQQRNADRVHLAAQLLELASHANVK